MFNQSFLCNTTCTISPIFTDCPLLFKNILKMKTNLSGLNDAKFQVKDMHSIDAIHLYLCRDGVSGHLWRPPLLIWIQLLPDRS